MTYKKTKISAAILAGGEAKRLNGIDKGNLIVRSKVTIIQRQIAELKKANIEEIIIVANKPEAYTRYGCPIIADNYRGYGPIAGIESTLKYYQAKTDAVLFLPCDLPSITTQELEALKQAYILQPSIVYAKSYNLVHPLCAILNVHLLTPITDLILTGERKIMHYWQQLHAHAISFANQQAFANINNMNDLNNWAETINDN